MLKVILPVVFLITNIWAFSPKEYFVDFAENDEDIMVLMSSTKTNAEPYYGYKSTGYANAGLVVNSEDGSKFEYIAELGDININGKKICDTYVGEEYFDKADKGQTIGHNNDVPCKRKPSENFPLVYQKTRQGRYLEGNPFSIGTAYVYYLTMPISEIKDQKIYSIYKGKKFWVDLNTTIYLRDMSILLSKKTKKKLWEDFLKNDRGFVEYYKKTFACNEKILNLNPKQDSKEIAKECVKQDGVNRILNFWIGEEETPLTYNGVRLDTYEVTAPSKIYISESFFAKDLELPKISESEYFEFRPFNLPFVYGKLSDNDRVVVYLKGPAKRFYERRPELKNSVNIFDVDINRITFVYYENSWHPLTGNEIYPETTR